jgi:hypothetical protein
MQKRKMEATMGRLKKKKTFLKKSRWEGSEAEKRKTIYK